jgi:hypothetical protein
MIGSRQIGRVPIALAVLSLALGAACEGGDERERCPTCGMFTDLSAGWNAGLTDGSGEPRRFDTPMCMLRYRLEHSGTRDPWVLDYYDQSRLPLDEARLVSGSDVVGPMGPDFVPVRASRAEGFVRDHGGHPHGASEVTPALLDSLRPH